MLWRCECVAVRCGRRTDNNLADRSAVSAVWPLLAPPQSQPPARLDDKRKTKARARKREGALQTHFITILQLDCRKSSSVRLAAACLGWNRRNVSTCVAFRRTDEGQTRRCIEPHPKLCILPSSSLCISIHLMSFGRDFSDLNLRAMKLHTYAQNKQKETKRGRR